MTPNQIQYRGTTALVTGGAGAVGSNLVNALCDAGCAKVIILDNLTASGHWMVPDREQVQFVNGDVTDDYLLMKIFRQKPDFVFHLAAFFANQNSVEHPEEDLRVNGLGTLRLLEHARKGAIRRFVYASSGASFYDEFAPLPITEDYVTLHQTTPYKATKMLGELYCNTYHHHYGLPVVKPRFFNSYGPGEIPGKYRNVIPNFVYRALEGLPLVITGTGDETRDFTYVGDLVDGILRAGTAPGVEGESFNLASGRETRILDLAEIINRLTGNRGGIEFTERRHWDTQTRRWADIAKARALLGFQPRMRLKEGLRITVQWFRDNQERIRRDANVEAALPFNSASLPVTAREFSVQPELVAVGPGPAVSNGKNGRHNSVQKP